MSHPSFRPRPLHQAPVGRAACLLALPALFALAACGGEQGEKGEANETDQPAAVAAPGTAAPGTAASGTAAPAANPVPPAVDAVGHYGENAYDMAKANSWPAARAAADSLKTGAAGLASLPQSAGQAGAVATALTALDQAITQRQQAPAMRAANRLTQLGAELVRPYHPAVPAEVVLLDYYGRELEVWSKANDMATLRSTAASLRQTWDTVKPRLAARHAAAVSARFDRLVAQVGSAKTPADYARLATPVLNEVDNLEKAFAP